MYYNIYSLVHRTDLKLAGLKLDACTMFSLAVPGLKLGGRMVARGD